MSPEGTSVVCCIASSSFSPFDSIQIHDRYTGVGGEKSTIKVNSLISSLSDPAIIVHLPRGLPPGLQWLWFCWLGLLVLWPLAIVSQQALVEDLC